MKTIFTLVWLVVIAALPIDSRVQDKNFDYCFSNDACTYVTARQSGDYQYFCHGFEVASGRGVVTITPDYGRIEHVKGDRTVLIQWSSVTNKGFAVIVQGGVGGCQIQDNDLTDTCP